MFERVLRPYGLTFTYVDMSDLDAVAQANQPNTRLIWLETPTNPLLKVADIAAVVEIAKSHHDHPWVAVDNTFASPALQRPLALGADFVVHSTTKYIAGHSDVVGGAVVTTDLQAFERLKFLQNVVGAVPGPLDCFLALRGLKTLALRIERHLENASKVAQYLAGHPNVEKVLYPGLPTHPGYLTASRQMQLPGNRPAFGGMISFIHRGGIEEAQRMAGRTKVFTLAESLGGVESLIEHPGVMTHASVAGSPLEVPGGLIRLSVGTETLEDLLQDLESALSDR